MDGFNPPSFTPFRPSFTPTTQSSTFKPNFTSNPLSQKPFTPQPSFNQNPSGKKFTPNFSSFDSSSSNQNFQVKSNFQPFGSTHPSNKSNPGSFQSQESSFRPNKNNSGNFQSQESSFRPNKNNSGNFQSQESSFRPNKNNSGIFQSQESSFRFSGRTSKGFEKNEEDFQNFDKRRNPKPENNDRPSRGGKTFNSWNREGNQVSSTFNNFNSTIERTSSKPFENSRNSEKSLEKLRNINKGEFQEDFDETEKKLRQKALATFRAIRAKRVPESKVISLNQRTPKLTSDASFNKSESNLRPEPKNKSSVQIISPSSNHSKSPKNQSSKPSELQKFKPQNESPLKKTSLYKMCSQEESLSRQESKQLNIFERIPGTDQCNPSWTIKKYLRSSADREEDQRTAEDLSSTLNYMINEILDVDSNGNPSSYDFQQDHESHSYQDIYPFLFDRMRAVVKDWKMLKSGETDDYIKDHEIIARFLIMSCVEGLVCESFNLNLNLKLTEDVLTCLVRAYEKRRKQGLPCANQAEFLCYFIITKPDNKLQILSMLKALPRALLQSKYIQLAIYLLTCYHNDDYEEFFNTVFDAPYLVACAAYPLFHKVRVHVFDLLVHQDVEKVPFDLFMQLFAFYDPGEAEDYLREFAFELIKHQDPQKSMVSLQKVSDKIRSQSFSVIPAAIQEKNEKNTRLEVILSSELFEDEENCEDLIQPFDEEKVEEGKVDEKKVDKEKIAESEKNENFLEIEKNEKIEKIPEKKEVEKVEEIKKLQNFQKLEPAKVTIFENNQLKSQILPTSNLFAVKPEPIPKPFNETRPVVQPQEVKPVPMPSKVIKRLKFEFPFEDKQIFSVFREKSQKEKIKENIRNYRSEKKLREKSKKRQIESLMKLKVFNGWKSLALKTKVDKFFENRKLNEMEIFKEQFSCLVISDNLNFQRFLMCAENMR